MDALFASSLERSYFYFPRFTDEETEAYPRPGRLWVMALGFHPKPVDSRDWILTSVSVQLASSSWDPNSFSVLLIWVSHRRPQEDLWSLLSYIHISDWFLQTLSGFWVCNPCLRPLLLPKQMPFYLEDAQLPNLSLVFWPSSLYCISPRLIWGDGPYIYHHDKQGRPSYCLIL